MKKCLSGKLLTVVFALYPLQIQAHINLHSDFSEHFHLTAWIKTGAQHDLTMKTVHTDICDKIDRQTEAVAKLKTSSSVIKKSEQDLEWKRKQVAKAVDNGIKFLTTTITVIF